MIKKDNSIENFLREKPGYLKKGGYQVALAMGIPFKFPYPQLIKSVQKQLRQERSINNIRLSQNFKEDKFLSLPKKLFFDIETSPNLVYSWNIGNKVSLSMDNIVKERAIICISYKIEGQSKVSSLRWNRGDDKQILKEFAKILNTGDYILVAHNGDQYDVKWLRARCLYHGIHLKPKFNTIDTLKIARTQFRLNSNKLNYLAQLLGLGKKIDTGGFDLWKEVMDNDTTALNKMCLYCDEDVRLLERVYNKIKGYSPEKKFKKL